MEHPIVHRGAAGGSLGRTWLLLALLLLLGACGTEQGRLSVVDTAEVLNHSQLAAAAQPLLERGADVAVVAVQRGDDSGAGFTGQLEALGLLQQAEIAPQAIAMYISFDPRYSELRAGEHWSPQLPDDVLSTIRQETLNPALRAGDPTGGMVSTFAALEQRLAAPAGKPWWHYLFEFIINLALAFLWPLLLLPLAWLVIQLARGGGYLADQIGRLRRAVARSAAGRLLAWLWRRSPPGRWQAYRRQRQELRREYDRLISAVRRARPYATTWLDTADPAISAGLMAHLQPLEQRQAALERRPFDDPGLPAALRQLAEDYKQCDKLAFEVEQLERRAEAARSHIEQVLAAGRTLPSPPIPVGSNDAASPVPEGKGKGKGTGKDKRQRGKAGQPAGGKGRQQPDAPPAPAPGTAEALAQLRARLAQLDQRRAELLPRLLDGNLQELLERRVTPLYKDYDRLGRAAYDSWAALYPEEAAAASRVVDTYFERLRQRHSQQPGTSYSAASAASSSSSSSSTWFDSSPGSSGSDSSSGPSSDGGSW